MLLMVLYMVFNGEINEKLMDNEWQLAENNDNFLILQFLSRGIRRGWCVLVPRRRRLAPSLYRA